MMTLDNLLGTSFFMPEIFTMGEKLDTGGEVRFYSNTYFGSLVIQKFTL